MSSSGVKLTMCIVSRVVFKDDKSSLQMLALILWLCSVCMSANQSGESVIESKRRSAQACK
jgi:EamA domain-containing membrane protein RarD